MQDDTSDEETIAVSRTLLLRSLPAPNPSDLISPTGLERLHQAGIETYAGMVRERGIGYPKRGRIAIADPALMDPVLSALGLMPQGEVPITLVHTSFGQTTILITDGTEIFIDPIVGEVTVYEGEREDPLWFELNLASLVDGSADDAKDVLPTDAGGDLHKEALKKNGMPLAGQCFTLLANHADPFRFSAVSTQISDIVPYLLKIQEERGFEITRIDPRNLPELSDDEY